MANTITFIKSNGGVSFKLGININSIGADNIILDDNVSCNEFLPVKNYEELKIMKFTKVLCRFKQVHLSAINSFNGSAKTYTTLQQLYSDFNAIITA